MKTTAIVRKLAVAVALAALLPAGARAGEREGSASRAALTPPTPVVRNVDARWDDHDRNWRGDDHDGGWRDGDHDRGWRDGGREGWRRPVPGWFAWRARERAELRTEYARLDDARARFYAAPEPPWRIRRFEAWYAHEHAELDARWAHVS